MYRWEKEVGWEGEKYKRGEKKSLAEWKKDLKYLQSRLSYIQNSGKDTISKLEKEIDELRKNHLTKSIRREISWKEKMIKLKINLMNEDERKLKKQIREVQEKIHLFESNKNPSHKGFKHKTKKRSNSWIHDEVLKIIKSEDVHYLMKEDIARRLEVKESQVEQVFHQLNLEGILHQPEHRAMHDSQRDPFGYIGTMAWKSDISAVRYKEENE